MHLGKKKRKEKMNSLMKYSFAFSEALGKDNFLLVQFFCFPNLVITKFQLLPILLSN